MREHLATAFSVSADERKALLPSGQQPVFDNRVGWARTFLGKAGLLSSTRRGFFQITEQGQSVLSQNLDKIDRKYLRQFPEYAKAWGTSKDNGENKTGNKETEVTTPEETLEGAYQELKESLASELLKSIMECSPAFFERLVVDLLIKIGYGGSRKEAGQAMGQTGDGGIDGIIKEDKLGLDIIYTQAKRWNGTVGRPEIQKFAGALQGQRAKKGIFITTSDFTRDAQEYVKNIDTKIILIDGERLAELMIDHNVGVSPVASYEVKKIDSDYFIEE